MSIRPSWPCRTARPDRPGRAERPDRNGARRQYAVFPGEDGLFQPGGRKELESRLPGKVDGTVSERIAYAITREAIDQADYLLDLHCGDGNEWLRPYVYLHVTGDARMDQAIERLAMAFGIDHVVVDRGRPTDPAASLYCSTTAITRGKPAITIESGSLGVSDEESVERIVNGIHGVLRELRMKDGGPEPLQAPFTWTPRRP